MMYLRAFAALSPGSVAQTPQVLGMYPQHESEQDRRIPKGTHT